MNDKEKHMNGDCDGGDGPLGCPYCKAEDEFARTYEAEQAKQAEDDFLAYYGIAP